MSTVAAPAVPLYDMGALTMRVRPRAPQTVRQPAYPLYDGWALHGLGADPAKIVGATAPIDSTIATMIAANAGAGSWAGPIGAGVGILVGVIAGLWAAHEARVKGAKAENQNINSAVQTFDAGLKAIFAAANATDATNVSGPEAAAQVQQLYATFWAQMAPYTHGPGEADASGGGVNCGSAQLNPNGPCAGTPGGHMCDKSCTATCCVGCQDLYPTMLQAVEVLNSPNGGTVTACTVFGSKYGAVQRSSYTLTYNPPALGALSSLTGGGGSLLPLALLAGALFLMR